VAELFGVDINKNAFGRSLKTHGAIIVQTDDDMKHFKTPRNECEILCKTGAVKRHVKALVNDLFLELVAIVLLYTMSLKILLKLIKLTK